MQLDKLNTCEQLRHYKIMTDGQVSSLNWGQKTVCGCVSTAMAVFCNPRWCKSLKTSGLLPPREQVDSPFTGSLNTRSGNPTAHISHGFLFSASRHLRNLPKDLDLGYRRDSYTPINKHTNTDKSTRCEEALHSRPTMCTFKCSTFYSSKKMQRKATLRI